MRKLLLLAATFFMTSSAFADVAFLFAGFDSGYVAGAGKVSIRSVEDGKLWVQWDQNSCSPDGRSCTRLAYPGETVTPIVLQDKRPVDGNLIIGLTQDIQLTVGSGHNSTGTINYSVTLTKGDGQTVRVPLKANIHTSIR